jgi:hypothetical protein
MANLFEEALSSIGAAIGDVREKVVEEGYFGRSLSDTQQATPAGGGNAFEQGLASHLHESSVADKSPAQETPEPGGGMER